MGIQNLLKHLQEIEKKKHVRAYAGMKVAVDGYCWLHKAVYTCKKDLAKGQGLDKLISFCLKRIQLMRSFNVTPVMVFDGGKLQMKKSIEEGRKKNREKCREKAEELLREGDEENAMKKYGESIDITPQMAHTLIKALQAMEVEYYVAPYEADAQLAYLWLKNHVQVVFTEDSDLLAFGCRKVFFKMDSDGNVKKPNFQNFTQDMLLTTCILSGCDYLDSIKGIGFMKAQKLVEQCANEVDIFHEVMGLLKDEGKVVIPDGYEEDYKKAFLTFKFQRVFCPTRQKLVMLHDITECEHGAEMTKLKDTNFLGKEIDNIKAQRIARGEIDPISFKEFIQNDDEDRIVQKVVKNKEKKTLFVSNTYSDSNGSNAYDQQQQMPPFLQNNPHPEYIELWKKHPKCFWQKYWEDKKNGCLKYVRKPYFNKKAKTANEQSVGQGKRGKKQDNHKQAKLKYNQKPQDSEDDDMGGFSPKASKQAKQQTLDEEDEQFLHDISINDKQKADAIEGFLNRTNYNGGLSKLNEQDRKTAKALREFRDEETKKGLKKREEKLKRFKQNAIKKKEKKEKKKKFMKDLEDLTLIAKGKIMASQLTQQTQQIPEAKESDESSQENDKESPFQLFNKKSKKSKKIKKDKKKKDKKKSNKNDKKIKTLKDIGGHEAENKIIESMEQINMLPASQGFQVIAPSCKNLTKFTNNNSQIPTASQSYIPQLQSQIIPASQVPLSPALQQQILMSQLSFQNIQNNNGMVPALNRDGPSEEFDKMFLEVMDPKEYKKKYCKNQGQMLPPTYLRKRQRSSRKKNQNEITISDDSVQTIPSPFFGGLDSMLFSQMSTNLPLQSQQIQNLRDNKKGEDKSYFEQFSGGKTISQLASGQNETIQRKSNSKKNINPESKQKLRKSKINEEELKLSKQSIFTSNNNLQDVGGNISSNVNSEEITSPINPLLRQLAIERQQRMLQKQKA
ncbi:exonuclease 1-like [Stylonychia lemnae]|uniref:Exonuclease 1 n=1 Tax=Stylonychia lemnae TaxID=5949 RepID=A0A078BDH4_STYLE|nr:exonuclease 1-like [Stylonychia lemnae]|eukprot:CDW91247.1 exonuclease 1-like [Stylonychia lemnae]